MFQLLLQIDLFQRRLEILSIQSDVTLPLMPLTEAKFTQTPFGLYYCRDGQQELLCNDQIDRNGVCTIKEYREDLKQFIFRVDNEWHLNIGTETIYYIELTDGISFRHRHLVD